MSSNALAKEDMMRRIIMLSLALFLTVGGGCSQGKPELSSGQGGLLQSLGFSGLGKSPDFVALAKKFQLVVVNISTTQVAPAEVFGVPRTSESPSLEPQGDERGSRVPPGDTRQHGLGSGFIIGSDGTILTNYHVVKSAEKIMVKLSDKREFEAKIVGKDAKTDIAVVKIDAQGRLPAVQLGDSDRLEVGEWVMAVGNPFGLDNSVTSGIVSAKGRHIGAGPYDSFIQTDAPMNPGNSGGPLVNTRGEVVGINMAIVSQTGGSIGIGFATPINQVKELLPQLKTGEKITRGWIGIAIAEVPAEVARSLGLEKPRGALVAEVVQGSPAERGGIEVGDIVTKYDGHEIKEAGELPIMVAGTPVNKTVQVQVLRGEKEMPVALTITELREPDTPGQQG